MDASQRRGREDPVKLLVLRCREVVDQLGLWLNRRDLSILFAEPCELAIKAVLVAEKRMHSKLIDRPSLLRDFLRICKKNSKFTF